MITLKRRGYTDTVTAIINDIYLEYHHLTGSVLINQSYTIEKSFKGRKYEEAHHKNLYSGKTNYKGENPIDGITELQSLIKLYAGLDVEFNSFVEAYDTKSAYNKIYPYLKLDKEII